jgi:hypothetical protein
MVNISMRRQSQIAALLPQIMPEILPEDVSFLNEGNMHNVYKLSGADSKVLKFRKLFPFGCLEQTTDEKILGEYLAVKLFYQSLQHTKVSVPAHYQTGIFNGQHWVCESEMSAQLPFEAFTAQQAFNAGSTLGEALYQVYTLPPPCTGQGELLVNEMGELSIQGTQSQHEVLLFEFARFKQLLTTLAEPDQLTGLLDKLNSAFQIIGNYDWPLTLVNEDLHPENIVLLADGWIAMIDPNLSVASGARFLAHFTVNCEVFWPLLLKGTMTQGEEKLWLNNLVPLGQGFREGVIKAGLPVDLYQAEQYLRMCYLLWRHQQYISGVSQKQSDLILGTVQQADSRLKLLLKQLAEFKLKSKEL